MQLRRTLLFDSEVLKSQGRSFIEQFRDQDKEHFDTTVKQCTMCTKSLRRFKPVSSEGSWDSRYVFQGIYPSEYDEHYGRPFHPGGPLGKLFEDYLKELGISRDESYVTNSCFCRTLHEIPTTKVELATCHKFKLVERERLVNMRYLFLLGQNAIEQVFGFGKSSIITEQGKLYEYQHNGHNLTVFPLYHPGYLIRKPGFKRVTYQALHYIRDYIKRQESYEQLKVT